MAHVQRPEGAEAVGQDGLVPVLSQVLPDRPGVSQQSTQCLAAGRAWRKPASLTLRFSQQQGTCRISDRAFVPWNAAWGDVSAQLEGWAPGQKWTCKELRKGDVAVCEKGDPFDANSLDSILKKLEEHCLEQLTVECELDSQEPGPKQERRHAHTRFIFRFQVLASYRNTLQRKMDGHEVNTFLLLL